ncbi:hypothetical protein LCGC14_1674510 [marine sediment metagenome]|uniref:Uncharacterized protein n=1 Tax=marine sediment metagenome TaxID=412755 RepID=A0A0F9ICV7_9ZZZZ
MEIINENYMVIVLQYKDTKKYNFDSYYTSLMGDSEFYNIKKEKKLNIKFDNIPKLINERFLYVAKINHNKELDENIKYFYPIDFSEIKRVVQIHVVGKSTENETVKYLNKSPGLIILYKYMGPITLTKEFIKIVRQIFNGLIKDSKNILSNFLTYKIIFSCESEYLIDIINHNYFIVHFEFSHKSADPNDFRRFLLGIKRRKKGKDPNEQIGKFGLPKILNHSFVNKIKKKRHLEEEIYGFPIDFSIIKRPVVLYTKEDGEHKISNRAAGVILIYQYMGPIAFLEDFRTVFIEMLKKTKKNIQKSVLYKAYNPIILIGAVLSEFEGFKN